VFSDRRDAHFLCPRTTDAGQGRQQARPRIRDAPPASPPLRCRSAAIRSCIRPPCAASGSPIRPNAGRFRSFGAVLNFRKTRPPLNNLG